MANTDVPIFAVVGDISFGCRDYQVCRIVEFDGMQYALTMDPTNPAATPSGGWRIYSNKAEAFRAARKLGKTLPNVLRTVPKSFMMHRVEAAA